MRIFTFTLTSGSISINTNDGVTQLSIEANASSECTIEGNFPFQSFTSSPIVLEGGQSVTLMAMSPASPIDGVTITHVSGTIDILIGA
jgi:hypothetical protein